MAKFWLKDQWLALDTHLPVLNRVPAGFLGSE